MQNNYCTVVSFLRKTTSSLAPPPGSSDEVSVEQESEDDINSSRTSLDKQAHHRANTTIHVCWHRNTSVSMSDHSLAVEVLLLCPCYCTHRHTHVRLNELKSLFYGSSCHYGWMAPVVTLGSKNNVFFSASLISHSCFSWVLIFGFFFFYVFIFFTLYPRSPSLSSTWCEHVESWVWLSEQKQVFTRIFSNMCTLESFLTLTFFFCRSQKPNCFVFSTSLFTN